MKSESKKLLLDSYKQREIKGGVCCIKNKSNGKMLILSAVDWKRLKNRFDFSITTKTCIFLKLKNDIEKFGYESFEFELLEEIKKKEDKTDKAFKEEVEFLEEIWKEKLNNIELY